MRLDREKDRGNIGHDTDIVGDGEYIGYAESRYGSWDVMFNRERQGGNLLHKRKAHLTIKGPFIGDSNSLEEDTTKVMDDISTTATELIDTWDYVELADEEVYSPSN